MGAETGPPFGRSTTQQSKDQPVIWKPFTVATAPGTGDTTVIPKAGDMGCCTDETGGYTLCFYNGTDSRWECAHDMGAIA